MTDWIGYSRLFALIGGAMSAARLAITEVLPHPLDNLWEAIQLMVLSAGVFCASQAGKSNGAKT